jgi:hypothetical protein
VNRQQLEHVIRAAATISQDDEIIVIGSQSILGQFPDAPASLLASMEADVYPKNRPELAELIEGSIGEESMFHATFGYYADGVEEGTATLPDGWKDRLVPIQNENTLGKIGWCLEVHDLAIAKYAAGREKDRDFVREAIRHGIIDRGILEQRLALTPVPDDRRQLIENAISADFAR